MTSKDELVFNPFIAGTFVKGAGMDIILPIRAYVHIQDQSPVEGVQQNIGTRTQHDLSSNVVDLGIFDRANERQLPDEGQLVQVPQEGLSI